MTVMLHDIYEICSRKMSHGKIDGLAFAELLYADDTLLVLKNTRAMNILLAEIETESAYYNMKLNKGKCNVIAMNGNYNVRFADGTPVKRVEDAIYLGGKLSKDAKSQIEITSRIPATMPVLRSLDLFWKQTKCSVKWKLNVYNAVVTSKLVYGLETLQFTDRSLNRMNMFQLKGLRKILGVQPTFIDRTQTNARVLALANKDAKEDKPPKIKLISEIENK